MCNWLNCLCKTQVHGWLAKLCQQFSWGQPSGATSDNKVGVMTILGFHCLWKHWKWLFNISSNCNQLTFWLFYFTCFNTFLNSFNLTTSHAVHPKNYRHCSCFVMPPPLGAGGIMFSGCPSVRPKPEIPSFDLYMGPLVHPTNRNHFTACPSVCPSVRPSGKVSGHLPENAWRDWPEILHADVSCPSSELISLWPWSVDFSNFGAILT